MWGCPEEERGRVRVQDRRHKITWERGGKTAASTVRAPAPPPCMWCAGGDYAVITGAWPSSLGSMPPSPVLFWVFFLLLFKAWFAAALESFISLQNKILCAHITTAQITTNQGWKLALFSRQVWTVSRQPRLFQSFPPSASSVKAVLFAFGHFFFLFLLYLVCLYKPNVAKGCFFHSCSEGFKLPLVFADATQNWLLQTKQCALTSSRTKKEPLVDLELLLLARHQGWIF